MKFFFNWIMKNFDYNEALREEVAEEEYDFDFYDIVHDHHVKKMNDDQ